MRTLADCNSAWIVERKRLIGVLHRNLAAPFLGYAPADFTLADKRILYVGKATEKEFKPNSETISIQGQIEHAHSIFDEKIKTKNEATFWGFARRILQMTRENQAATASLAWSNICRVGELTGAPKSDLVSRQHALAMQTLKVEIEELKPTLIVFVCHHDGDQVIQGLCADPHYLTWEPKDKSSTEDVWWRSAQAGLPAMVWMRHPQSCPQAIRTLALQKVAEFA